MSKFNHDAEAISLITRGLEAAYIGGEKGQHMVMQGGSKAMAVLTLTDAKDRRKAALSVLREGAAGCTTEAQAYKLNKFTRSILTTVLSLDDLGIYTGPWSRGDMQVTLRAAYDALKGKPDPKAVTEESLAKMVAAACEKHGLDVAEVARLLA